MHRSETTGLWVGVALLGTVSLVAAQAPISEPPPAPTQAPEPVQPGTAGPPKPIEAVPNAKDVEPEIQLFLYDGRRFTGFLVEKNPSEFILRIAGIKTPFRVSQVERYQLLPPVLERYRELRKAIDEDDGDQILRLVEWLTARHELDLGLLELDGLIKRQPENGKAVRARAQLLRQIDLRDKAVKPIGGPAAEPEKTEDPASSPSLPGAIEGFPHLADSDIALMKVYEINTQNPPRIEIPRDVITSLIEKHGGHPSLPTSREGREGLYRLPVREQLELIFKVRARELYPRIKVIDQPETMRLLRDEVQRNWLLTGCATTACHGGSEAGRLVLATRRPSADPTLYTNFYILQNFRLADGTPLISFDEPDRSPLLQMALPREDAQIKHPRVLHAAGGKDAWKPVFRSRDDARFQQAMTWLKGAYRPRPDYGITYTPLRPFTAIAAPKADPGR